MESRLTRILQTPLIVTVNSTVTTCYKGPLWGQLPVPKVS
jgi:hypothetical protein